METNLSFIIMFIKLGRHVNHDERMNLLIFRVRGQGLVSYLKQNSMARRHALFFGRHALFPSAMPLFSAPCIQNVPFLTQMLSCRPWSYLSWPRRYTFWCMAFSHRWVHTLVHQCTGRPIRSGVINWLAVIKNQVDSVAGSFNSPGVFVYLSTGEYSRTEAPVLLLNSCAFICLILNFQPRSYPDVK